MLKLEGERPRPNARIVPQRTQDAGRQNRGRDHSQPIGEGRVRGDGADMWTVTITLSEDAMMPAARGLLAVQKLNSLGQVLEVTPDVRADGKIAGGEELSVVLESDKSAEEIKTAIRHPAFAKIQVEEGGENTAPMESQPETSDSCQDLKTKVEEFSEAFVFADATDPESVLQLRDRLREISEGIPLSSPPEVSAACASAIQILDRLVQGESPDPSVDWRTLQETTSALQALSRGDPDLEFPKELTEIEAEAEPEDPGVEGEIEEDAEEKDQGFSFDISPELIACFVSESTEHLENADVHLLTIETDPKDSEALNAVFRGFHTIKGSAGMLGLKGISKLAHEAENLLGMARDGKVVLEEEAIDAVFDAVDALRRMVGVAGNALTNREAMPPDEAVPHLIARIKAVVAGTPLSPEPSSVIGEGKRVGEALVESGVATSEGVEKALSRQASSPKQQKKVGEILREANLTSERKVSTALDEQKQVGGARKLGEILVDRGEISEEELEAALEKQRSDPSRPKLGELLVRTGEAEPKDVAHALRGQKRGGSQQAAQIREAVKVDADRLDGLIDTIGELVIAESMVSQSEELRSSASPQLLSHIAQLQKITRELQEMGTSLRMVPVRPTFQKMARLVRDLAKKAGKKVEFVMSGEDTELDKTVVDNIGDPLIHMIRNSVDHGIEESPRKRLEAGKDEVGHVNLRAYHKGGNIYIEVQDDGRGLDRDAILAKALERGLVREGESLSDREIYNQIFQPGFSTAKKITDVSGRGVGMDVVKRSIEGLRGQVDIMSEPAMGTIFTIRLPLTLAIIDGMVIRVGTDRYIVPTLSVVQSIRPNAEDLSSVLDRGAMLSVQDRLIPLFPVARLFDVAGAVEDPQKGTVVVVEDDGKQTGLLVDELLGQQQIVIKPLGELLRGTPGLSGGAIMPDGQVGLILDVAGLVRLATSGEKLTSRAERDSNGSLLSEEENKVLEYSGVE